ncbi:peptidase inhibitor family I36 protein [Nonomuraea sp. NPDC050790]|uniref:peptidase inhibitor family I36 protein n=1 Tax=Nonomuraea sp. NPDC050790 TaxID=3364371 RepID=UPI0037A261CB
MRALLLSVVAFFVMTGLPAPAQATTAAAAASCPAGHVCLYNGTAGQGYQVCAVEISTRVSCRNVRSAVNNGVSDPGKNDARLYDAQNKEITCVRRGQTRNLGGLRHVYRVQWGTC